MTGEIRLVVDDMRAHARELDGISQSGREAVEAGSSVRTQGEAYGLLCSFVGASTVPAQEAGILNTKLAVQSVRGVADALRYAAQQLERSDENAETAFSILRSQT